MKFDLNAQGLKRFPEPPENAAEITVIDAGCNRFRSLPSLAAYPNLSILELDDNLLEDLPEGLAELPQLRQLTLSGNPFRGFPEVLTRLSHLEVLLMDRTGLEEIPAAFHPADLVLLSAMQNRIASLHGDFFSHCRLLKSLYLEEIRLKTLPASVGCMAALTDLDLAHNELEDLPKEFGQLRKLEDLRLQGNRLRALPEGLGQLTGLRVLCLEENQLTALPDSIGQLARLENLDVSRNRLISLPPGVGGWRALRGLNLNENRLTSLPPGFCRLPALTHCYLESNRLSDLPAGDPGDGMPCLQAISAAENAFPNDWMPPAVYRDASVEWRYKNRAPEPAANLQAKIDHAV